MNPATIQDCVGEASGGYIIVTKKGDVLAQHVYNRNYFEEYLLKIQNMKLHLHQDKNLEKFIVRMENILLSQIFKLGLNRIYSGRLL